MIERLITVPIVNPENPDEYVLINERDFDPKRFTKWEDKDKGDESQATDPADSPPEASDPLNPPDSALRMRMPLTLGDLDKRGLILDAKGTEAAEALRDEVKQREQQRKKDQDVARQKDRAAAQQKEREQKEQESARGRASVSPTTGIVDPSRGTPRKD